MASPRRKTTAPTSAPEVARAHAHPALQPPMHAAGGTGTSPLLPSLPLTLNGKQELVGPKFSPRHRHGEDDVPRVEQRLAARLPPDRGGGGRRRAMPVAPRRGGRPCALCRSGATRGQQETEGMGLETRPRQTARHGQRWMMMCCWRLGAHAVYHPARRTHSISPFPQSPDSRDPRHIRGSPAGTPWLLERRCYGEPAGIGQLARLDDNAAQADAPTLLPDRCGGAEGAKHSQPSALIRACVHVQVGCTVQRVDQPHSKVSSAFDMP